MKISEMSNTSLRIITAGALLGILVVAILLEAYGIPYILKPFHAIRWLAVIASFCCFFEMVKNIYLTSKDNFKENRVVYIAFLALLLLDVFAAYFVGAQPWILLLMLMIIVGADVGAWFFGKLFGGDKMWERLSEHKTWSGQIGGIISGTFMGVMFGLLGADTFRPELLWVGISVSLLSQYGDLTASYIKRKLGIKDFANTLPGHGGVLDRFDGWVYVLPLLWLIIK